MKIDKPIITWTEKDLKKLRNDPYNLEDMNIEYKERYSGDSDELRKDVVSFANSRAGGYILYGIRDDPFDLIGMTRGEVDNLKNTINNIIERGIDPHLDPTPILNPIYLSNGNYILGMQILPKEKIYMRLEEKIIQIVLTSNFFRFGFVLMVIKGNFLWMR